MEIKEGSVVIAKAGRDKGKPFAVVDVINSRTVLIADGKSRPLEHPKRKNIIHLQATAMSVDCNTTNRQLRKDLNSIIGG
ncbi:MAG: KOW domain-containing RNA-binding protein [Ruminococcus sp.]|nr:KOW domain-containing RNA-binding protein [Ruminococcus sp.]